LVPRHLLHSIALSVCLALLAGSPLFADDTKNPTSSQLYDQGMSQYSQGDYQGALETFRRINRDDLSKAQRLAMYQTVLEIDRRLREGVSPSEGLNQAAAAAQSGNWERATQLYESVASNPNATEDQRQAALDQVSQIRRRIADDQARARRALAEAEADIQAGRIDEAERTLQELKSSGLDLGWFDNERVQRLLEIVAERRAQQAAAAPAQAAPPQQPQQQGQGATSAADLLNQAKTLRVQEKLAQARQAEQAGQYHLAAKLYQDVLSLDPGNARAQSALGSLQGRTGAPADENASLLEAELQSRTLRTSAAVAEFEELINRATSLLDARNFSAARQTVQQAKIVLDMNRQYLPPARYDALRESATALAARVDEAERAHAAEQTRLMEEARRRETEQRRAEALRAQEQEVQNLLRRAADFRREQKYEQALEVLNQALFLDPDNVAAQAMKEMIEDSKLYVEARERLRQRGLMASQQASDSIEASTPYTDLLAYPADWPRITASRLTGLEQSAAESEINRQVVRRLKEIVPINFDGNKLEDVLDYIRNTTNVNLVANWSALAEAGIERSQPITLQLTNIPADQALRLVLQQAAAANPEAAINYSIIDGVVTISTQADLSRTTDIRSYDIRDLLVQVPNFSDAPEFDLNAALSNTNTGGSTGIGGGGGGGRGGGAGGLFATEAETTEELKTRQELVDEITTLIRDTVGRPEDWEAAGGSVSSMKELNGVLIVRTTPENHRQIATLLRQLRETRALQIAIETRFLFVDQNFLDELEVDLDLTYDNPTDHFGPVTVDQGSASIVDRPTTPLTPGAFLPDTTTGLVPRSLNLGVEYLDDLEVNLVLNATQASRRAFTLTAPRVTLFNGQRGYVMVARQLSFVSDLEPIPDAAGFDPTISVTQEGVILDVEATVSADRRYVTLTVRPSLAQLRQTPPRSITIKGSVAQGQTTLPTTVEGQIELPDLQITTLKTSVSVPDRGTLLLGGQRLKADVEIEAGVPVMSKVPVLNRLFTNRSSVQDEQTLLILIKPTIIVQSEEEENLFPGLRQETGQIDTGT
jgi:type II secretory pathway component GspD/PulD (secretin)